MFVEKGFAGGMGDQVFVYGGAEYGGKGRTYKYGGDAPADVAWLPDILPAHLTQKCLAQQLGHFSPVAPVQGPETLGSSALVTAVP